MSSWREYLTHWISRGPGTAPAQNQSNKQLAKVWDSAKKGVQGSLGDLNEFLRLTSEIGDDSEDIKRAGAASERTLKSMKTVLGINFRRTPPAGIKGLVVTSVSEPAIQGGLRVDDIIETVRGIPVNTTDSFLEAFAGQLPGDQISFQVCRGAKPNSTLPASILLTVTLAGEMDGKRVPDEVIREHRAALTKMRQLERLVPGSKPSAVSLSSDWIDVFEQTSAMIETLSHDFEDLKSCMAGVLDPPTMHAFPQWRFSVSAPSSYTRDSVSLEGDLKMGNTPPPHRFVDYFLALEVIPVEGVPPPGEDVTGDHIAAYYEKHSRIASRRFPLVDYEGSPLPDDVKMFVFSCGPKVLDVRACKSNKQRVNETIFFTPVLTDSCGVRLYVSCVHYYHPHPKDESVYMARCLCLLSHYPFIGAMQECVRQLYEMAGRPVHPNSISPDQILTLITREVPLPLSGGAQVAFQFNKQQQQQQQQQSSSRKGGSKGSKSSKSLAKRRKDNVVRIFLPPASDFPLLDVDLGILFKHFSPSNVILLLTCVLTEQRLVFHSEAPWKLTLVCESLLALIYPFRWDHVYVPLLPRELSDYIEAPVPYMLGIHSGLITSIPSDVAKAIVVVDVDNNIIETPITAKHTTSLPSFLSRQLREDLDVLLHSPGSANHFDPSLSVPVPAFSPAASPASPSGASASTSASAAASASASVPVSSASNSSNKQSSNSNHKGMNGQDGSPIPRLATVFTPFGTPVNHDFNYKVRCIVLNFYASLLRGYRKLVFFCGVGNPIFKADSLFDGHRKRRPPAGKNHPTVTSEEEAIRVDYWTKALEVVEQVRTGGGGGGGGGSTMRPGPSADDPPFVVHLVKTVLFMSFLEESQSPTRFHNYLSLHPQDRTSGDRPTFLNPTTLDVFDVPLPVPHHPYYPAGLGTSVPHNENAPWLAEIETLLDTFEAAARVVDGVSPASVHPLHPDDEGMEDDPKSSIEPRNSLEPRNSCEPEAGESMHGNDLRSNGSSHPPLTILTQGSPKGNTTTTSSNNSPVVMERKPSVRRSSSTAHYVRRCYWLEQREEWRVTARSFTESYLKLCRVANPNIDTDDRHFLRHSHRSSSVRAKQHAGDEYERLKSFLADLVSASVRVDEAQFMQSAATLGSPTGRRFLAALLDEPSNTQSKKLCLLAPQFEWLAKLVIVFLDRCEAEQDMKSACSVVTAGTLFFCSPQTPLSEDFFSRLFVGRTGDLPVAESSSTARIQASPAPLQPPPQGFAPTSPSSALQSPSDLPPRSQRTEDDNEAGVPVFLDRVIRRHSIVSLESFWDQAVQVALEREKEKQGGLAGQVVMEVLGTFIKTMFTYGQTNDMVKGFAQRKASLNGLSEQDCQFLRLLADKIYLASEQSYG